MTLEEWIEAITSEAAKRQRQEEAEDNDEEAKSRRRSLLRAKSPGALPSATPGPPGSPAGQGQRFFGSDADSKTVALEQALAAANAKVPACLPPRPFPRFACARPNPACVTSGG